MKKFLFTSLIAVASTASFGQVAFVGTQYSQNFNSLISSGSNAGIFSSTIGTVAAIPNLSGWYGAKIAGDGGSATALTANNGSVNGGGLYSMGATSSNERSLGAIASGSNTMVFGVAFTNTLADNGLNTAQNFEVTFDKIQYRSSTITKNVLAFSWFKQASFNTNGLTSAGTALTAGDVVGDDAVTSNGALATPSTAAVSFQIQNVQLAPGETLWLRWADFNDAGNDAMLGIDNFTAVPEPASMAVLGLGLLGFARRRRNK